MRIFFRILRYLRPYWRRLALSIVCTVFYSVFSGASIYLSIPLVETLFDQSSSQVQTPPRNSVVPNEIVGGKQQLENLIKSLIFTGSKTESLFKICTVILIVFLLKNLFGYVQSYLMAYVEQGLMMDIRNELYRHLHNLIQSVKERLTWDNEPEVDEKLEADLKDLMRRDKAFREKHYPVHKACKCYYCRHPDGQNDE